MTETAGMSPEDAAAARAAEQARIRKERREAKIKAGGSARLNKITGLGGGIQRDPVPVNPPSRGSSPVPAPSPAASAPQQQQHADPEEIDISQHYYKPQTTNRIPSPSGPAGGGADPANISEDQLRQMMLGLDRPAAPANGNSGAGGMANPFLDPSMFGGGEGGPDPEDPMMKMLSQMLGGGAGGPGGAPSPFGPGGQNPFAQFAAMNNGGQQQQQQQQQQAAAPSDAYTALWRLLHFLLALGLGLYAALAAGFAGTRVERERGAFAATTGGGGAGAGAAAEAAWLEGEEAAAHMRRYFFWMFATAETVLLTSRFFLDRGRAPPPGMLYTVMGFLPEGPWKTYLATGLRYTQIFTTVRSDILVCVFVMGVCAWLRS